MFRLVLIVIFAVIGGGVFLAYKNPSSLPGPLQSFAPMIQTSISSGIGGAQTLLSKGKDAQPAVLGIKAESSKIFKEDTSEKPITQKAMEFTQYQYCKMIVKSYEEQPSKSEKDSSSSDDPAPEKN